MKSLKLLILLATLILANTISAQKMITLSADDAVILSETKTVLTLKKGSLVVEMIPPKERINKKYRDIDLKKDDKILFINGKKVKTAEEFRDKYDKLNPGEEVKLGVKRGDVRFIVKFPKADPSKTKGMKMMRVAPGQDPDEIKKQLEKDNK